MDKSVKYLGNKPDIMPYKSNIFDWLLNMIIGGGIISELTIYFTAADVVTWLRIVVLVLTIIAFVWKFYRQGMFGNYADRKK